MPKKILKISIPKNWIEAFKKNNLDTNLDLPIKNILKEIEGCNCKSYFNEARSSSFR